MGRDPEGRSGSVFLTRWLSFFGVDPVVVVLLWNRIGVPFFDTGDLSHAKPKHLLWAFLCLRKYGDESEMAALCGASQVAVDEKTFRKWRTIFVKRIACLKYNVVSHLFMAVLSVIAIIYLASHHSFLSRSFGRTGRSVMWATTVSFQSTALMMPSLISKLPPMLGIPRSSMHMVAV